MSEIKIESELQLESNPFDVRLHPDLALQTYEYFGSDSNRGQAKVEFANGETYHLQMQYPRLEPSVIDVLEGSLKERRQIALETFGDESLTVSSIDNRLEEVEFLKIAYVLNSATFESEEDAQEVAEDFVEATEQLYGKPDQGLVDSILGTIRARYDSDDAEVKKLWDELESGFEVELLDGTSVSVPSLSFPDKYAEIPTLSAEAKKMLRKEWVLFGGVLVEAQSIMSDIIASKMGLSDNYTNQEINFDGPNLAKLFKLGAVGLAEVLDTEPFNVVVDEHGSVASWDSGKQAVIIGANRPSSMGKWDKIRGTTAHEATHGIKSVNGLKSGEPSLSSGVFTRGDDGSWVSYLDFEEGNNKLGESLIMNEDLESGVASETVENDYLYTIVAGLVYRGLDDRKVAEVMKKLLLIERRIKDPGLDIESAEKSVSELIATKVERMFRGTNTASEILVDGHVPIFTKDLAYMAGTLEAIEFWNTKAEEAAKTDNPQEYIHHVFNVQNMGKINPLDPKQYKIAEESYLRLNSK